MNYWHAPATVVYFFQWTYLAGVTLTALSLGLGPGPDLRLAATVFVPVAVYTILMVMCTGLHRLGHLAPIAVWLACASTVMVRALGRTPNTSHRGHYRPVDRPLAQIEAISRSHGAGHLVLVQPSEYGTDNSLMLRALAVDPCRHRGVAVVDDDITEVELDAMHALGVRGVRFGKQGASGGLVGA